MIIVKCVIIMNIYVYFMGVEVCFINEVYFISGYYG